MKLLTRYCCAVLVLLLHGYSYSQQMASPDLSLKTTESEIIEVFGEEWANANSSMVNYLVDCKRERISFLESTLTTDDKYPLLSTYPLMTKNNPGIEGANFEVFNPDDFNVFAYSLDFFSDKVQAIRVDGTNYVMIIQPVKNH